MKKPLVKNVALLHPESNQIARHLFFGFFTLGKH
jgi:hypothetical protein